MLRPETRMVMRPSCGNAALGDVDVGHDLEPGDHTGLDAAGRAHHLVQHAVDAEPDAQVGLVRLHVDVGGAIADGLVHQQVDELDDRGVFDDLGEAGEVGVVVGLVGRGLHDLVDLAVDPEEPLDRLDDLARGGDDGADLGAGEGADVVDCEDVRRVGHRDDELAVLPSDRDGLVAARERLGDDGGDGPVDGAVVQVDELEADLARERAHELGFGDRALFDEQPAEWFAGSGLLGDGRVELGLREESFVDE
jgi:hypothetical protein